MAMIGRKRMANLSADTSGVREKKNSFGHLSSESLSL